MKLRGFLILNNFKPTSIKEASRYLDEKLSHFKEKKEPRAYKLEEKKKGTLLTFLRSFFHA